MTERRRDAKGRLLPKAPEGDTAHVPVLRAPVRVRFPASLHPAQPAALGTITDIVGSEALVWVWPSRHMPQTTVTVPHRSRAKPRDGWWERDDGLR